MRSAVFLIILWFISLTAYSATYYVPDDYSTIQAAINAAANNDTIIVRSGTYVEQIDFNGKAITLRSAEGPGLHDGSWCPVLSPALQFQWPLGDGKRPSCRSIAVGEDVKVDLGELDKNLGLFRPLLYEYKDKFGKEAPSKGGEHWGCVEPEQTVKYYVYFVCDQFVSRDYSVEISWDGQFSNKRKELAHHLNISMAEACRSNP